MASLGQVDRGKRRRATYWIERTIPSGLLNEGSGASDMDVSGSTALGLEREGAMSINGAASTQRDWDAVRYTRGPGQVYVVVSSENSQ